MRLTEKLMKELHEELWGWLAEDPKREKWDWPRWEMKGGDIPGKWAYCFPCAYAEQTERDCCPLDIPGWNPNSYDGFCLDGLYDKWRHTKGKARSALAKQIAELPIRKRR